MARRRPSTLDAFLEVRGVGERKRDDYGDAFITAIVDYCSTGGVPVDVAEVASTPAASPRTRVDSAEGPNASSIAAFTHFRRGSSIEDTMEAMGRAHSTVTGYLSEYLRHEQVQDPSPWVEDDLVKRIELAIAEVGLVGLKPIFDHLGGEVPYEPIRIVATCVANREG